MTRCISGAVVAGVFAVTLGAAARQADAPKSVTASVTVTTSDDRRTITVLSKGDPPFLFCIDLAKALPMKITDAGKARVWLKNNVAEVTGSVRR